MITLIKVLIQFVSMYHMNIINYPGFSNIRSEKSGFFPNSKFNVVFNVAKHV